MNTPTFTPERSKAMRAAIIQHVTIEAAARSRRPHPAVIVGLSTGLGLLVFGGGLTAASAAGLLGWPFSVGDPLPGGDTVIVLPTDAVASDPGSLPADAVLVDQVGVGSAELPLPEPPPGATHVSVQITCFSAGDLSFGTDPQNNPGIACDRGDESASTWYDFPVDGQETLYVTSATDVQWRVAAVYVARATTDWSVNAKGETFGIENETGTPDLIAALTTDGKQGYVYADQLAEIDRTAAAKEFTSPEDALRWQQEQKSKTLSVPVYLSDGETVIGEFIVQNR